MRALWIGSNLRYLQIFTALTESLTSLPSLHLREARLWSNLTDYRVKAMVPIVAHSFFWKTSTSLPLQLLTQNKQFSRHKNNPQHAQHQNVLICYESTRLLNENLLYLATPNEVCLSVFISDCYVALRPFHINVFTKSLWALLVT